MRAENGGPSMRLSAVQLGHCRFWNFSPKRIPISVSGRKSSKWLPIIKTERTCLLELLDRLIIPALNSCQKGDNDLNFSSGYLTRLWPAHVTADIHLA